MNANRQEETESEHGNRKDAKDMIRGAAVNFLGMLAKTSKILFVLVAARMYGVTELGLYFLAWAAVDLASKFGLWGIDRSLIRDISRLYIDQSEATKAKVFAVIRFNVTIAVCLSMAACLVLYFLTPLIAVGVFGDENLVSTLRVLALALPFIVLTICFIATTKALRMMRYEVLIRQTLEPLVMLAAALILIPLDLGAPGLAMAHLVAAAIGSMAAVLAMIHTYRTLGWHRQPLSVELKKDIIRFTSPMAAMDFINMMVSRVDLMLVGAIVGSTAAGMYGIAVEIVSIVKRVRQGFEPIFSPIVSQLFYSDQSSRLQRNYIILTRWLITGTLLPVLAMVLYPTQLLAIFSEHAVGAAAVLVVLAVAHGLHAAFNASEHMLVMSGKTLLSMALGAAALTVSMLTTVPLTIYFGIVGAAGGTLITYFFLNFSRVYAVNRIYHLHPFGTLLLWPLGNACLVFVLFFVINQFIAVDDLLKTVMVLILMTLTYVSLYFMGPKETEERYVLTHLRAKLRRFPATTE